MALFEKIMSEEEAKELESSGVEKLEHKDLKEVNGGFVYANANKKCFEVIDDKTGEVLASGYPDTLTAQRAAAKMGQSIKSISSDYLEKLRQGNK